MPDLRNGSLEGEQYLEELQVPPSSCTSLKNSSLLCSRAFAVPGTALGHSQLLLCGGMDWLFRHGICGFIGEKCPLLHFLVSFSSSRFFFFHSPNDCNRILFSCSQLLAISNLIQSGLGTEFNTFLPLRGCC